MDVIVSRASGARASPERNETRDPAQESSSSMLGPGSALANARLSGTRDLPFRQLQLDAAVALVGFVGGGGVERLEFREAGRGQPLRRPAERNQVTHHRD